jgi:hypothetical protein
VREVASQVWHLVDDLVEHGAAIGTFAYIIEDARVKDCVHPQVGEGLPEPEEWRIVGVPPCGDELPCPPQAQLVVATLGLLDHEIHCAVDVASPRTQWELSDWLKGRSPSC